MGKWRNYPRRDASKAKRRLLTLWGGWMSGGPRAAAKGFRSKPYAESAWLWGEWMSGGPGRRPSAYMPTYAGSD